MTRLGHAMAMFVAVMVAACGERGADTTNEEATADRSATTAAEEAREERVEEAEEVVEERVEESEEAVELTRDASEMLREMKTDPDLNALMANAQGLLLVPEYGRVAVGIGGRGGEGVLVARRPGGWSDPAFFDLGGVSMGPQLGGEGGEVAIILMTEDALDRFKTDDEFTLNAEAGLTLVDFSAAGQAAADRDSSDVVFWSDTEGLFAGASLSLTDVSFDEEENRGFYGRVTTAEDVLAGEGRHEGPLQRELADLTQSATHAMR